MLFLLRGISAFEGLCTLQWDLMVGIPCCEPRYALDSLCLPLNLCYLLLLKFDRILGIHHRIIALARVVVSHLGGIGIILSRILELSRVGISMGEELVSSGSAGLTTNGFLGSHYSFLEENIRLVSTSRSLP